MKKNLIIEFVGSAGSGKTTLYHIIKDKIVENKIKLETNLLQNKKVIKKSLQERDFRLFFESIDFLKEISPINEKGRVKKSGERLIARYMKDFWTIYKRVLILNLIDDLEREKIVLIDEGIFQKIRALRTIYQNNLELKHMEKYFQNLHLPDILIIITSNPEVCLKRRKKRDGKILYEKKKEINQIRKGNKLTLKDAKYAKENYSDFTYYIIENNGNLEGLERKADELVDKIIADHIE